MPEGVETLAYADDLAIMVKAKDETELVRRENEAVERVARWMEINHLAPAPGKTEAALRIGRKKCRPLVGLGLRGFALETKKEVKYLGVVRDQGLTFAPPTSTMRSGKPRRRWQRFLALCRGPEGHARAKDGY